MTYSFWLIIVYSDLSCLILSKSGVPLSWVASRLALTQVFLFLTYFPSSNMNSSIVWLCLWSGKWKLYGKNVKFSDLVSFVALRVCLCLQDTTDTPFMHLFYCILHHVKIEECPELKWKQENCMCYFTYMCLCYYRNLISKYSQFCYWHSKEQIPPGCLGFKMKWWHENYFIKIFSPLNAVGIQHILEIKYHIC